MPPADMRLCLSYSGGLDSTVLLHAARRLCLEGAPWRLRAIHIDHGLQTSSAQWARHCADTASSLGVEFLQIRVQVAPEAPEGLEAAARRARYDALRVALRPQELLLTAHHADDQLETMLLALLRGAGLRGLSAMPVLQPFGGGWLLRPLLAFTRADLERWAKREHLQWIRDPSNEQISHDRNYLRHRIAPVLRERWPAGARSAARSAAHLAEAQAMLDELAAADLAAVSEGPCLNVEALRTYPAARRRQMLRYWLREAGVRAPSARKLAALEHDMLGAGSDRVPCVQLEGAQVRRYRGLLYCLRSLPAEPGHPVGAGGSVPAPRDTLEWHIEQALELPEGLGRMRMQVLDPTGIRSEDERSAAASGQALGETGDPPGIALSRLKSPLQVRFRQGGESLRPAGQAHRRKLKKLLQSAGVLPWWRERLPLVYSEGRLLAVGDLWIEQEFAARQGEPAARIVWEDRPALFARER